MKPAQRYVFDFFWQYKWLLSLSLVLIMLSSTTLLAFPYLSGKLLDVAAGKVSPYFSSIEQVFIYMLCFVAAQGVFSYWRMYIMGWVSENAALNLTQHTYGHLLSLPMAFYDRNRVGDLLSRLQSDILLIQQGFSINLAEAVRQIGIIIVSLALIIYATPRLSVFLLLIFPIPLLLGFYFGSTLRKISAERQSLQGQMGTVIQESFLLINVIKAFTAEKIQRALQSNQHKRLLLRIMGDIRRRSLFISLMLTLILAGVAIFMGYGALLVQEASLSTGDLVTFVMYTTFLTLAIGALGDVYGKFQKMRGAADRMNELLRETSETQHIGEGNQAFTPGDLHLDQVSFHYPSAPDIPVLKDLTLHVRQGQRIALVGQSGAGKSTLLSLLLRFYSPQKGSIRIGGHDTSTFSLAELRNQIGIVPQDTILFGGTIADNIRYGRPDATDSEVELAAQRAYITEFTDGFPKGLDTSVGERGIRLSGGQRQRIAVARIILKAPSILILDEATSALDSHSERWVQEAWQEVSKKCTTLVIAHRLSTVRNVDGIYVISQGSVIEAGTHAQLLEEKGLYHQLIEAQKLV